MFKVESNISLHFVALMLSNIMAVTSRILTYGYVSSASTSYIFLPYSTENMHKPD